MGILFLALLYIVPLVFIICMVVFRDCFTLQQAGIITSLFTVIPAIVTMLEISRRFRKEGNQSILDLINWFRQHKHESIAKWLGKNQNSLERCLNRSIIVIPTSAFVAGQIMQLLATY